MSNLEFRVRPFRAQTDAPFVYDAWIKFMRAEFSKTMRGQELRLEVNRLKKKIDSIISRGHLFVACAVDDGEQLFGFAAGRQLPVGDTTVLDFVFVKRVFQGQGICGALLKSLGWAPVRAGVKGFALVSAMSEDFDVRYHGRYTNIRVEVCT